MAIGQRHLNIGHAPAESYSSRPIEELSDVVFEKPIFDSLFNKDIRRIYIYKKAEQLANAMCLIAPAFKDASSFKTRTEGVAVALVEAAALPALQFRDALARELLALTSLLSMARAGGLLSAMNADLIAREARGLLADIAAHEEPPIDLGLRALEPSRPAGARPSRTADRQAQKNRAVATGSDRQSAILSLIKDKGAASIKDIILVVPGVSEKTVQRELAVLIDTGRLIRRGERRWSTYALP